MIKTSFLSIINQLIWDYGEYIGDAFLFGYAAAFGEVCQQMINANFIEIYRLISA